LPFLVSALIAILLMTVAALVGLRLVAPRVQRISIGRCELATAVALPVLATFGHFYALLVIGVVVIVIGFPILFGGDLGRQERLEKQLQTACFAIPLLPIFYRDVTLASFTLTQLNYVLIICIAMAGAMLMSGVRLSNARLVTWDLTFLTMIAAQLFMDVRGDDFLFFIRTTLQLILNLGLPYFVFSRAMVISENPSRLFMAMLLATSAIVFVAAFELMRSWLIYDDLTIAIGANPDLISGYGKQRGGMLRPRATWTDSTSLSLYFAVMLTFLCAMRRELGSRRFVRILAGILMGGIFITLARVGYIAAVAGITACFLYERRYGRLALFAGGLPIVAGGLFALGRAVPMIGVSIGIAEDAADTFSYREMLLRDGLALWREHWLIGLSYPDILVNLEHLRQGEGIIDLVNQPLQILLRGGIVFAFVYYAMTIRLLTTLFTRRRRLDPLSRALAGATFAALIALLAGSLTTNLGRNELIFVILLGIGAGTLARRATSRAPAPPPVSRSAAAAAVK
jgi:hypothetical protein